MSKIVYVLTRYEENEIVGVVDSEEKAKAWLDSDISNRDFTEFVLNKIPCEECKGDWKFEENEKKK